MIQIKEIGEFLICTPEADYMFRPSFENMMRIGEPQEIVQTFADLHSDEITPLIESAAQAYGYVPAWLIEHIRNSTYGKQALMAAMSVMQACSNDDLSLLIGDFRPAKSKGRAFKRRVGQMGDFEIIVIAQSLITHGIIGKSKGRKLQRNESGPTTEFNAFEYISAARMHFGISREEAQQLTMTEFQIMLSAKYPPQKGYTKEEYDSATDDYFSNKAKRIEKEKKNKKQATPG